jgi:RimJ/RimL family protein N-acetyltransferase
VPSTGSTAALRHRIEGDRPPDRRCRIGRQHGDDSEEPALGYWLGQPHWRNGYAREAVAAIIDYGLPNLGMETIRAYTDPTSLASQKVLLHCGLKKVGEIELIKPTRHGARHTPLFRISAQWATEIAH